jgi:hypothetical protein
MVFEGVLGGYVSTTSLDVFGLLWRGELVPFLEFGGYPLLGISLGRLKV